MRLFELAVAAAISLATPLSQKRTSAGLM